jgi:hypothetical protein
MVIDLEQTSAADINSGMQKWENFPASYMSHHGAACCDTAREWIIGMDFSQLHGGNSLTGPRWLRSKFKWGPSKWPMHWCEAVKEKTLDCGALGALSHQLFLARGVRSFAAQLILEFNDASTRHWHETWSKENACAHWISEGLIYHEGCAVAVQDNEIKVWDSTATWWVNPKQFGGYAGLLALRVFDLSETPGTFKWGAHTIPANTWTKIERARGDFGTPKPAARKPRAKRRARGAKSDAAPAALV